MATVKTSQKESNTMATTYERLKAAAEEADMNDDNKDTKPVEAGIPISDDTIIADDSTVPETNSSDTQGDDVTALKARIDYLENQLASDQTYKAKWQTLSGMLAAKEAKYKAEIEELKRNQTEPVKSDPRDYDILVEEQGETTAKLLKPYLDTIASLQDQISNVAGDVQTAKEKAAQFEHNQYISEEDRFFNSLDRAIPDWKKINGWDEEGIPQDSRFNSFAHTVIPGTNFTYQDALEDNYRKRDVVKVAEIYNLFKKSVGANPKQKVSNDAEKYIEPDKTGKGVKAPNASDSFISHSDYEKFVDSIKKGTFRGTREERLKLEEMYDKAFTDNRIR